MCRPVSSWVGDHQRIPTVDCFCFCFCFSFCFCFLDTDNLPIPKSSKCLFFSLPGAPFLILIKSHQIFAVLIVVLSLGISNATFSLLRKSHDFNAHPAEMPRHPSAQYPPPQPHGINRFDAARGMGYGGHQLGWQDGGWGGGQPRQDVQALEYCGSPSKGSRSPDKRMPSR
jgi:hypothetical protein